MRSYVVNRRVHRRHSRLRRIESPSLLSRESTTLSAVWPQNGQSIAIETAPARAGRATCLILPDLLSSSRALVDPPGGSLRECAPWIELFRPQFRSSRRDRGMNDELRSYDDTLGDRLGRSQTRPFRR